jgi:hypothetical protein
VNHTASSRFRRCYEALPADVRDLADKNFRLLKADPMHPTLHFKLLASQRVYSARVGLQYRTLGLPTADGVHWFWIGTHAEYDRLIGG